jgi:hypothetical protein
MIDQLQARTALQTEVTTLGFRRLVTRQSLFNPIGCVTCHVSTLTTDPPGTVINGGTYTVPAALGNKCFILIVTSYGTMWAPAMVSFKPAPRTLQISYARSRCGVCI